MDPAQARLVVEIEQLSNIPATKKCGLCGFITEEKLVVCPEDGSALLVQRPDPLIGKTLNDRFQILSRIGSGGMGNVYKAKQAVADRLVAVKVLHSERLHNQSSLLRFKQEAKAAGSLSHPNIVSFIDFGFTDEQIPFLVMDFVEGLPLDHVLRNDTLSVARCINIFSQACDALEHAHSKGIIHRDIKPSNLMLVQDKDGSESLKILDFGIAKLLPADPDNKSTHATLTMTGELFGSPQYMSPEQCAGASLDARSDMYSLGCVMYEALTGRAPINGESVLDIIYKHSHKSPAHFKQARPDLDIPEQLEAVILKTLEKEPARRFPSMQALKRNLEFAPHFAEESKNHPQQTSISSRHTYKLAAAACLCVVLGTGIAGIASLGHLTDRGASLKWYQMRLWATETFFPNDQTSKTHLLVKLRDIAAAGKDLPSTIRYGDAAIASAPTAQAAAIHSLELGDLLAARNDDRCLQHYAQAVIQLRRLAQSNRNNKQFQNNLDGAAPIDNCILQLDEKLKLNKTTDALNDLLNVADDTFQTGNLEQAEPLYQKVLLQQDQLAVNQAVDLADHLARLAKSEQDNHQFQHAQNWYKLAIDLKTKTLGPGQQTADWQRNLGLLYQNAGDFNSAETTLLDSLATTQAVDGQHSTNSIQVLRDLAQLYTEMKEREKAASMLKLAEQLATSR